MIEFSDLKRGVCLQYKGAPVIVTEVKFSNPTARGASMIGKTKMRNLLTGQVLSDSFRSGDKFEEVDVEPASELAGSGGGADADGIGGWRDEGPHIVELEGPRSPADGGSGR